MLVVFSDLKKSSKALWVLCCVGVFSEPKFLERSLNTLLCRRHFLNYKSPKEFAASSCLSSMEEHFSGLWGRRWVTYSAYVQHMSRDGSWGDELLLQSPVRIVSDNPDEVNPKLFRTFYPPDSMAADCWGPLITLAFLQFSHSEATEKLK